MITAIESRQVRFMYTGAFLSPDERLLLRTISDLAYGNPFLPERVTLERAALGSEFVEGEPVWSVEVEDPDRPRTNVWKIIALLEPLVERLRQRVCDDRAASASDLGLYQDAVLHLIYHRSFPHFVETIFGAGKPKRLNYYAQFLADWERYFQIGGLTLPTAHDPRHIFACFYQIARAFHNIFLYIIGSSLSAARLRCPPFGSVFLDELGDLELALQVKLLRVIETRTFHPVGGTASRQFQGKLIAATNRHLATDMQQGRFREDLYYRLCSDVIITPTLGEQLRESPDVMRDLVRHMARRVAGQLS